MGLGCLPALKTDPFHNLHSRRQHSLTNDLVWWAFRSGWAGRPLDVSPRLAIDDALSDTERTLEEPMQALVAPSFLTVKPTHFKDLRLGELGVRVSLPAHRLVPPLTPKTPERFGLRCEPAFPHRVLSVVHRCASKQMVRPDTGGSVTVMANENARRNFSVDRLPRKTMRGSSALGWRKRSVTGCGFSAGPKPAFAIRFVNTAPKPLNVSHIDSTIP